jgi:hypothetical protein
MRLQIEAAQLPPLVANALSRQHIPEQRVQNKEAKLYSHSKSLADQSHPMRTPLEAVSRRSGGVVPPEPPRFTNATQDDSGHSGCEAALHSLDRRVGWKDAPPAISMIVKGTKAHFSAITQRATGRCFGISPSKGTGAWYTAGRRLPMSGWRVIRPESPDTSTKTSGYLSGQPSHPFVRVTDDSPAESSSTQSLVPPCFVNQLLGRFAWIVNGRSRSNVSSFDGRHAQEKGRRPSR